MLSRSASWKLAIIITALIATGTVTELFFLHPIATPTPDKSSSSSYFDYLVVIVLENKNLDQVYGASCSGNCSYITQLADTYGLAENYSGVAHLSMPNYMTLTSGGNYSYSPYTHNCYGFLNETCQVTSKNVVDAIENTGRTWKVYITNYGSSGCKVMQVPPFVYYTDIYQNTTRCSKIVDASPFGHSQRWDVIPTTLLSDLNNVALTPNFMWLGPSACDTGYCVRNSTNVIENRCGQNSTTFAACVSQANEYLSLVVPKILDSAIFRTKSALLFITWDEGAGIQGFGNICPNLGQTYPTCNDMIPAILVGTHVKPGFKSNTSFSHYSFVKTLGIAWNTSLLDGNSPLLDNAAPMTAFFDIPSPADDGGQMQPLVSWILAEQDRDSVRPGEQVGQLSLQLS